jgi:hypothetical protein
MAMQFIEQVVALASGTLHLHADGTYQISPPFRSADIPWPRRMRIRIAIKDDNGATSRFDAAEVALHQDGTYELEP